MTLAAIAFDFSAGWEYVGGFQDTFEQNGGRVVARLWPPTGTPDFSPYLSRIPRDVDAVYAGFSGADDLRFLQQYRDFGLMGRIPLIGSGNFTDDHVLFQESGLAKGIVTALHSDDPRGPVRLHAWGNPIENVYIRRVDIIQGRPQNTVIFTYKQVSQFWTLNPEEYLKRPAYTRDYPPPRP